MARASASMKIVRISANRLFYPPGSNLIAAIEVALPEIRVPSLSTGSK